MDIWVFSTLLAIMSKGSMNIPVDIFVWTSLELGHPQWLSGKESACNGRDAVLSLGWEGPLEAEMATHSNVLPWEILWTKERGELQSMGSQSDMTEHIGTLDLYSNSQRFTDLVL